MNDVDLMKCMDLAAQLGRILGMNPVWKKEYVIFSDEFDEEYVIFSDEFDESYTQMSLDLDNGCWQITTGEYGVLNLPQEVLELMAEMSMIIEGDKDD